MRLAIADPPYLGHAEMWYGERAVSPLNVTGRINPARKAASHLDAHQWDDPESHRQLVADLQRDYDGWAVALLPANLFDYLQWVPRDVRIAVWHDSQVMPTNTHPYRRWEAVLVYRPAGRRRPADVPLRVGDVFTCGHDRDRPPNQGYAGRKPRGWTDWVLAMLGHCADHDTVDDLFPGSGAVTWALDQGRLTDCKCR